MAISDLAKLLSNPTDVEGIEPATLQDVSRANIIDMSDRLTNRTEVVRPEAFTPESTSRFSDFITNPDFIKGLAAFGTAFAGGRPNEPGTILGQFATQQVNQGAERRVMARVLAGEDISDISQAELEALTPEALVRLEQIRGRRAEESQGERALDIRGRALDIDERYKQELINLREAGVDLERWGLILDNRRINLEAEEIEDRIEIAREDLALRRQAQRELTEYRNEMNRIRELQATNQDTDTSALDIRRERLINTLSARQETLARQELFLESQINARVEEAVDDFNDDRGMVSRFLNPSGSDNVDEALNRIMLDEHEFTAEERAAGLPALVNRYKQVLQDQQDYSTAINKLIDEQKDRVLGTEGSRGGENETSENTSGDEAGEESQTNVAVYRPTDEDIRAAGDNTLTASTFEEFQQLLTPDNAGKLVSFNGELVLIGEETE